MKKRNEKRRLNRNMKVLCSATKKGEWRRGGVDKERGNIRRVHTRRGNMKKSQHMEKNKRETLWKKNEEDQNGNSNRDIFLLTGNTKIEIDQEKTGICFQKSWKTKCVPTFRLSDLLVVPKKTKETRYFVERDRNRRKMAKTKQAWN